MAREQKPVAAYLAVSWLRLDPEAREAWEARLRESRRPWGRPLSDFERRFLDMMNWRPS